MGGWTRPSWRMRCGGVVRCLIGLLAKPLIQYSPGIELTQSTLTDFISFLASGSPASKATASALASSDPAKKNKTSITFSEFRDFLIMLPRKASIPEIYKCGCHFAGSETDLILDAALASLSSQEAVS